MEEATLLFKHLPSGLTQEERKDLLHYLGATQVRLMGRSGPLKHAAFAIFPSKGKALEIVEQLHQTEFLGSRLVIEFARSTTGNLPSIVDKDGGQVSSKEESAKTSPDEPSESERKLKEPIEAKFDSTFATWGLKHPRRPDLKYLYPPPTPSILTNIMHALAAVPRFYVQVLHLMNKMDLPAPFGMITPKPPITPDVTMALASDDISQREMDISSSSESELESGSGEERKKPRVTRERQTLMRKKRPNKKPRFSDLQDINDPSQVLTVPAVPVSEVFENQSESAPALRKIEMRISGSLKSSRNDKDLCTYNQLPPQPPPKTNSMFGSALYDPAVPTVPLPPTVSQTVTSSQPTASPILPQHRQLRPPPLPTETHQILEEPAGQLSTTSALEFSSEIIPTRVDIEHATRNEQEKNLAPSGSGFGILLPMPKDSREDEEISDSEETWGKTRFISSSELRKCKLSEKEMKDTSVFRRYAAGEPSCRLYIKNLAKQVTEKDLHRIFGRYVDWDEETEANIFDIRLMKEGRMKGQAFITLPNEKAASSALKDTNGFVFQEKPMVVQFARSAKAEEDKATKL